MNRNQIADFFGHEWVDFMAPFVDSPEMDKILVELSRQRKEEGKSIFPSKGAEVFRCFKETPLSQVRVVLLGQDPYFKAGYANGIAFGMADTTMRTPPSLEKIINAVEKDAYGGLNFDKPNFDKTLVSWCKQGVLMLNSALTAVENKGGEHLQLWQPFAEYVIKTMQQVKKQIIYLAWGAEARDNMKSVNTFFDYMPPSVNHPSWAAREQVEWDIKHFSLTNAIITANKLGEPIDWGKNLVS